MKRVEKKILEKNKRRLISVVLATYNEKENLSKLIPIIEKIFKDEKEKLEIIVVDDNSPDGTANIARKMNKKYHNVKLLLRPRKMGPGSAHADGYRFSRGSIVIGMDVDFSHNPYDIPTFIKKIDDGYDLVVSSRYAKGGKYEIKTFQTLRKKIFSFAGNILINFLSRIPVHDFTGAFRAIRREVIDNVKTESKGNSFFIEFIIKAGKRGYKITEVPIVFKDRVTGKSKLNVEKQSFITLMDLFKFLLSK